MRILGIETSCDETGAAIVDIDDDFNVTLVSNVVSSSMDLHKAYGGVVPEIAARSHLEAINPVIEQALLASHESTVLSLETSNSQLATLNDAWDKVDAIAVTYGAGLGGCLLVGVMTARTLAITKNKPLYACNHVEGHVYANFISKVQSTKAEGQSNAADYLPSTIYHLPNVQPEFPLLALIVSGGHSQLAYFRNHFDYTLLGQTQDDAIGEAFDKVAKIIGLPYPGGPSIAKAALTGNDHAFDLPKAKMTTPSPRLLALRQDIENEKVRKLENKYTKAEGLRPKESIGYQGPSIKDQRPTQEVSHELAVTSLGARDSKLETRLPSYDFSFSGLKTAVLRHVQRMCGKDHTFPSFELPGLLNDAQRADIAATFQRVAIETVVDKTVAAYDEFAPKSVVIAGGVAANQELRRQISARIPIPVEYTDIKLCTDNGAMIATLGAFRHKYKQPQADPYTLEINPNLSM